MIGDDLLVAPILKPDVTRRLVYLPAGTWYDYWTNKKIHRRDDDQCRRAARDRADVCAWRGDDSDWSGANYVGEKPVDPITFNIYPDERGSASTTL